MAQGMTVRIYGEVNQQPPYVADATTGNLPSVSAEFGTTFLSNLPADRVNIWEIKPGVKINGVFCYGVIEVPPSGLNQFSEKFIVQNTVASLATLRG